MKHGISRRAQVQILRDAGHSKVEAVKIIGKPRPFIDRWWNRETSDRKLGSGGPSKITRSIINQIVNRTSMKKRRSSRVVSGMMTGVTLSHTSILKVMHDSRLRPYHPRKKAALSQKNIKDRRYLANQCKLQDWHKVLFMDEKKVTLVQMPNRKNDICVGSYWNCDRINTDRQE